MKENRTSQPGYYHLEDGKLKFVSLAKPDPLPTSSNDDILKVFSIFLLLLFGVLFSSIVFVMSLVIEPPSIVELIENQKSVRADR